MTQTKICTTQSDFFSVMHVRSRVFMDEQNVSPLIELDDRDFDAVRAAFREQVEKMKEAASLAKRKMENLFSFAETVWPEGTELLMLVTQLSAGADSARFIAKYGSEGFQRNAGRLGLTNKREQLLEEIAEIT